MNTIPVHKLTTNHKVQIEKGDWLKIDSISNGLYWNSKIITYSNGLWSCLLNTDKVKAIDTQNQ